MKPAFALVFFDVDSTLVTFEGVDWLADGNPEVRALTESAMNGRIPVEEVYGRRLDLIRPSRSRIEELAAEYQRRLLSDAEVVVAQLREAGVDVHLITGGIEQAVAPLAAKLGLAPRSLHAVRLQFDDAGEYVDFDRRSFLAKSGGKEIVLRDVRAQSHGRAAFVGDGMTDAEARNAVDLFIGFGGVTIRERVREVAEFYITEPRLSPILPLILKGDQ
ncbi:MAG: HAD-IB family phosphatase [Acidobacteriota bacterium]